MRKINVNGKKVLAVAMAAAMMVMTAACGSSSSSGSSASDSSAQADTGSQQTATTAAEAAEEASTVVSTSAAATSSDGEKLKIGVVQMIDNGAFQDMREGFLQEMNDKGYTDDNTEFILENAQGDATNLNTICQSLVEEDVDLVATIATPATQAMVNTNSDIPVVFIAVSNPVAAGVITDMDKPDKNATGTSNAIPVENIFNLADQLTPDCDSYGIIYNTSETNSVSTAESAEDYLESQGKTYEETLVTNSSEVQQAAQNMVGKVDAIFVPNDAVVQSAMPQLASVARENGIPVYGSSAVMVTSGALATVAITDTKIGAMSADMAIEILQGKDVADVPAVVVDADTTVINQDTADALGVTIPDDGSLGDITLVSDDDATE